MRRYPALLWVLVFVGSLFVLNGGQDNEGANIDGTQLAVGIGLIAIALVAGTWLALAPWPGRPRPRAVVWAYLGVLGFYVACAVAALLVSDTAVAAAALLAGLIPLTAVNLWIAQARALGIDDGAAELHDDLTPHDVPKGRPARKAIERQGNAGLRR